MPPLVLVPCSSGKTLPIADGLRGRALSELPADQRVRTWQKALAGARRHVPVRDLYKGGAWTIAREAAVAASCRGGAAYVVSAGLGLAAFDTPAPGYDITFTAGSPDIIPEGASAPARATWWSALAGPAALERAQRSGPFDVVLVALPEAYLEAVAPSLVGLITTLGVEHVSVFASRLSPFARQHLSKCWVKVTADQTTTLRGNAGQSALSALLHALQTLPADAPMTRPTIHHLLSQLTPRDTPLYPKRERLGCAHATAWIASAVASTSPSLSASEALRRYRDEGFAYEQKAFHRLFAEVAENT